MSHPLDALLREVRACTLCTEHLPLEPRPVLQADVEARLRIVGQAPSTRVHASGLSWNDASGKRLREWLQLSRDEFYDPRRVAIMATGLCYPGKGNSGDLPPRPECAPRWHPRLTEALPNLRLTLLIGQYAQRYYLGADARRTLTDTVRAWRDYQPDFFPLPHPSPRNQFWLKRNPWFAEEVLPALRQRLAAIWDA